MAEARSARPSRRIDGTGRISDVAQFARTLQRAVQKDALSPDEFMTAYERGLRAAYEQHDIEGMAGLIWVAANRHDVDGTIDDAIVEVEFALRLAGDLPDARLFLLSIRAQLQAALGHLTLAREALTEASTHLRRGAAPVAVHCYQGVRAMLQCIALEYGAVELISNQIDAFERAKDTANAWFVTSWFIPLLLSGEQPRFAAPWTRKLQMATEGIHTWRSADATVFEYSLRTSMDRTGIETPLAVVQSSRNWLALSRALLLVMRHSLLNRDLDSAATLTAEIAGIVPRAVPDARGTWAGFSALLDAYSVPDRRVSIGAPTQVLLANLGGTFAGMEAIAIAGSQADAVRWLTALRSLLPPETRTAPEWPVSKDRMLALLMLRAGDLPGAARALRAAADWSHAAGFNTESAIARLQLAELATHTAIRVGERRIGSRERVWQELLSLGVDPVFQAYVVSHAVGQGRGNAGASVLTAREAEVLRLLAQGRTYREAATDLGVTWKTVQSHAYHAYGKLGASRRSEAVETAQRIGAI